MSKQKIALSWLFALLITTSTSASLPTKDIYKSSEFSVSDYSTTDTSKRTILTNKELFQSSEFSIPVYNISDIERIVLPTKGIYQTAEFSIREYNATSTTDVEIPFKEFFVSHDFTIADLPTVELKQGEKVLSQPSVVKPIDELLIFSDLKAAGIETAVKNITINVLDAATKEIVESEKAVLTSGKLEHLIKTQLLNNKQYVFETRITFKDNVTYISHSPVVNVSQTGGASILKPSEWMLAKEFLEFEFIVDSSIVFETFNLNLQTPTDKIVVVENKLAKESLVKTDSQGNKYYSYRWPISVENLKNFEVQLLLN